MAKDRRQKERELAENRAKAIKAQPTDESYYERLLRLREHCLSNYEAMVYNGDMDEAYKYKAAFNHAAHQVDNYEKLHGATDGVINITWDIPEVPTWTEEQEEKFGNRPDGIGD